MARMRGITWIAVTGTLAAVAAPSANAQDSGFWLTGFPQGGKDGSVQALSQNGSVVGGWTTSPGFPGAAFSWTVQGGRDDWGIGVGLPPYSPVYGISSPGDAFAGWMTPGPGPEERAYRRVRDGPLENLGVLPNRDRSFAWGMSGDGNVVVGHAQSGPQYGLFGEAFRWTPSDGMQGLGHVSPNHLFSQARGISRDGKTIVGDSWEPFGPGGGFVWTEATGMNGLPGLAGEPHGGSARAVNADGSVVVGLASGEFGGHYAVRWINGQIEALDAGFSTASIALSVSDDGDVVGGTYLSSGTTNSAALWSPLTGMLDAKDFLALHGVTVPADYRLEYVYAVSGDGFTFAGQARNLLTNQEEGFVATVPTPGAASMLAAAMPMLVRRRVLSLSELAYIARTRSYLMVVGDEVRR